MSKLSIDYETWNRPDANGLYDYHQSHVNEKSSLIISQSGCLFRNKEDYTFKFLPLNAKTVSKATQTPSLDENFIQILKIRKKDESRYYICEVMEKQQEQTEQLCKIISNQEPEHGYHLLQENDILKFGKVYVNVLSMKFCEKSNIQSHYEKHARDARKEEQKISKITVDFYEKDSGIGSPSMVETNPECRYCHSKTITKQNPFIISCKCKGYTKYVHQECLVQWILQREKLFQYQWGIYCIKSKHLLCELCHQYFELQQLFSTLLKHQRKLEGCPDSVSEEEFHYQQRQSRGRLETSNLESVLPKLDLASNLDKTPSRELLVFEFKCETSIVFFVDLSKTRSITIGRGSNCNIILNELSVSRNHAELYIDSQQKTVILMDHNAKFGTLLKCKKTEVGDNQLFQLGRSKIHFKKLKRKTLFDKIAFCFVEQKLNKEKKKTPKPILKKEK